MRGWIYMLVPVVGLGLGEAHADKKMDWTPFLEPASSRPQPKQMPAPTEGVVAATDPAPAVTKGKAKAKPAPKKKAASAAQKPKRKTPTRRK